MAVITFVHAALFALLPLVRAQTSFLQQTHRHRDARHSDSYDVKLCTVAAEEGHDNLIKVFAVEADNTRYVSFSSATDDGFIESMQKCEGALPASCKHQNTSSPPGSCTACSCTLDLKHDAFGNYQRRMLELLVPQCQSSSTHRGKDPYRVLVVGLGGGALVQHILGKCPKGTVVTAVEYDPRMVDVATRYFGIHRSPGVLEIQNGDGGKVIAEHAKQRKVYDMVLVDAFAGGSHVPASCRDAAFVSNLRIMVRKGGSVLANMAGPTLHNLAGTDDYKTALPIYEDSFGSSSVELEELRGNMEFPAHLIVANVPA